MVRRCRNAYIERFNRIFRDESLDLYLFARLDGVREGVWSWRWIIEYNEQRPHDSLGDIRPVSPANALRR